MKRKDKQQFKVRKHLCDIEVGRVHGAEISLILGQLQYWICRNAENEHNFRDGAYWTYNSVREWSERMPYISYYPMKRLLRKMVDLGLIRTGNWNRALADRTRWYTITKLGWQLLGEEPPLPPVGYEEEEEEDSNDDGTEPVINSTSDRCRIAPVPVRNSTSDRCQKAPAPVLNRPNRGTESNRPVQNTPNAMCKTAPASVVNSTGIGAKSPRVGAKCHRHTNRYNGTTTNKEQKKNLHQAEFPKSAEADYRISAGFGVLGFDGTGKDGSIHYVEFVHDNIQPDIQGGIIGHLSREEVNASFEHEKLLDIPPIDEPRLIPFYPKEDHSTNLKPLRSEPWSSGTSKPIHSDIPVPAKRSHGNSESEKKEIGSNNHAENTTPKMPPPEPLFCGANEAVHSTHPKSAVSKKVYSAAEKKAIVYYAFIYHFDHDDPDINGSDFAKYLSRFDEKDYERFDQMRQAETDLPETCRSEPAIKPPPDNTVRPKPTPSEPATEMHHEIPDSKRCFTEPWIYEEYDELDDDDKLDFEASRLASLRAYARNDGACPKEWWMVASFTYMRTVDRKDRSVEDFETRYLPSFTIELFREYRPLWKLRAKYSPGWLGDPIAAELTAKLKQRRAEKEAKLAAEKAAGDTAAEVGSNGG